MLVCRSQPLLYSVVNPPPPPIMAPIHSSGNASPYMESLSSIGTPTPYLASLSLSDAANGNSRLHNSEGLSGVHANSSNDDSMAVHNNDSFYDGSNSSVRTGFKDYYPDHSKSGT